tara:strand:- start:180 stop:365 length:186 start_codon:yes stop_codon:yes gene_type:complete
MSRTHTQTKLYKFAKNIEGDVNQVIRKEGNHISVIPLIAENTDYQRYLEWVAAGNTAEAAD